MSLSFFFARKLQSSRSNSFTRVILRLAVMAVALSLAVMITTVCIVTGFRGEIRDKVTGFAAHIQITPTDKNDSYESGPVASPQIYVDSLGRLPGAAYAQVYAFKPGIIKTKTQIDGIVLKGVDRHYHLNFFKQHLVEGKVLDFGDTLGKQILISKTTADRLSLKAGDKMNIYFVSDRLTARPFVVSGIYETGLEEFDKLFALVDIGLIRRLNGWNKDQSSGIEVMVKNLDELDLLTNMVHRHLPVELSARNMHEMHPQIFEWLSLVDTNVYIIIIIMAVIALVTMLTVIIVLIIERTQMIGMLKSLGAGQAQIRNIFLYMAGYVVVQGLLIGNVVGIGFCWLQQHFKIIMLPQESYYMKYVPIHFDWAFISAINVGTFLVCVLFLLLPSLIITKISPLTAIKFS